MNNQYIFILSLIIWKCVSVLFGGELYDEFKWLLFFYKLVVAKDHSVSEQTIKLM